MRRVRATLPCAVAVAACFLAFGCESDGGGADAADAASPGARVVLGTGRETFEVLDSEGTVPLIKGIQGGFHVWTSFLAYGFDNDVLRMELATRWDELDESVLEMAGNVAVRPSMDADGVSALMSLGWPASIFDPVCSNGRRLVIALTVRDVSSGISASDSRHWIVDVAEADRSSDCVD